MRIENQLVDCHRAARFKPTDIIKWLHDINDHVSQFNCVINTQPLFSGTKVVQLYQFQLFSLFVDAVKLTPTNNEPIENYVEQIFVSGARLVVV